MADATIEQVAALRALTEMLVGVERTISGLQAARDGILALGSRLAVEVAAQADHPDGADLSARTVAAEFGAALRASDRTVQRRMADAVWIVERFPRLWGAWGAGQVTARHARVIAEAGVTRSPVSGGACGCGTPLTGWLSSDSWDRRHWCTACSIG